jgi:DNA-binding NtrC family response regulator
MNQPRPTLVLTRSPQITPDFKPFSVRYEMPSILFCWLGKTDLDAMQRDDLNDLGPIARSLAHFHEQGWKLDQLVLLSNYDPGRFPPDAFIEWVRPRLDALGAEAEVRLATFPNPTDFRLIYEAVTSALGDIDQRYAPEAVTRYFHLSPGTSAMTAVWLLLGKTTHPAQLLGASREDGVRLVEVPFDIFADYIPSRVVHDRDQALQQRLLKPLPEHFGALIFKSDNMRRVVERASHVAPFRVPVLLMGESGTGKTQLAQCIHRTCFPSSDPNKLDKPNKNPFIVVNCGAIPRDLVESELFGSVRGAFTGATHDRKGLLRDADGGTLFLDEIAELPLDAQSKLLRAIESQRVRPVGDSREYEVKVRVISATHQDLRQLVAQGRFREDLYYRLAVATLTLPPLRERISDLPLLVDHLLARVAERLSLHVLAPLSKAAHAALRSHHWPGNVRELENVLTQAVLWSSHGEITAQILEDLLRPLSVAPLAASQTSTSQTSTAGAEACVCNLPLLAGFDLQRVTDDFHRPYIERALSMTHQNRRKAASLLGFQNHTTFLNWIKRLNISPP